MVSSGAGRYGQAEAHHIEGVDMHLARYKWRLGGVAAAAALAVAVAGCGGSSGGSSGSSGSGSVVKGGTVNYAMPAGVTYNWIFPFYSITEASVYNDNQFQWLFYRPLIFFGGNNLSVTANYALSPVNAPVYSNGGKTVTLNFKGWKWSDGETVGADSFIFYMNMVEAEKANWYGYAPGLLPDNVTSYKADGPNKVVMTLNKPYSSLWYTYNQLSEITPMPEAWDVTSLGAKAGSGGCEADSAKDGWAKCKAVYTFLTAQAKNASTYATSPLWSVVDGPWKLKTFSTTGNDTIVPNTKYSGSPKPKLAAINFKPYTSDSTEYTALKTGQIDAGYIPTQDLPQKPASSVLPTTNPVGSNYKLAPFYAYAISYFQPDFNNPTVGPMFRQLYVRQALQYLVDQPGQIKAAWGGYAYPTSGAVPTKPANPWLPPIQKENGGQGPYPFSIAKAKALFASHGWKVVSGVQTCETPGSGASDCGAGVAKGAQMKFSIDYSTGIAAFSNMMATYKSDANQAGVNIAIVGQSFNTIIGEGAPCPGGGSTKYSSKCSAQALEAGGWAYDGPGYLPTGEPLFYTGAGSNSGSYSDPQMDSLINLTHTSSSVNDFFKFATFAAQQLPFIWQPANYGIQATSTNLHDVTYNPDYAFTPEYWYLTK
jgi:peptide/nickel transport system substrate-binding protein